MSANMKDLKIKSVYEKLFFTPEQIIELSKMRVIQKNLVHVQGFPNSMADKNLLCQKEYFGQFGYIKKIVLVKKEDNITKIGTNSAYITYSSKEEAAFAILATDSFQMNGHYIRSFFGTSKYCIHFLNNRPCYNQDKCVFIHELANENEVLGNETKFGYGEHIKLAKEIIDYNSKKTKNYIKNIVIPFPTVLPTIQTIYTNDHNIFKGDFLDDASTQSSHSSNSPKSERNNLMIKENNNNNCNINKNNGINKYLFLSNSNNNSHKASFCNSDNSDKIYKANYLKYENKSRFFSNANNDNVVYSDNIYDNNLNYLPNEIFNFVDDLLLKKIYFYSFEKILSLSEKKQNKNSEISLFKLKYGNLNNNYWVNYIIQNTEYKY